MVLRRPNAWVSAGTGRLALNAANFALKVEKQEKSALPSAHEKRKIGF